MFKNIVFDVGDVLISFRWEDMLIVDRGMSRDRAYEFANKMFYDDLWKEFDLENLTFVEVVDKYIQKFPEDEEDIRWFFANADLMPVDRPKVWAYVEALKEKGYGIYLLSNYSSQLFEKHALTKPFMQYVDGMMVSYMVHEIKPHLPIYNALFEKYKLNPSECIFFDDRMENVEGAIKAGMMARQVPDEERLISYLKELL